MSNRRAVLIGILVLIVLAIPALARLYTDLLWFRTIELESVFTTLLSTAVVLWLIGGLVFLAILLLNLRLADKSLPRYYVGRAEEIVFFQNPALQKYARLIFIAIAVAISLVAASSFSREALTFLAAFNNTGFDVKDPIFSMDAGFYAFVLPAVTAVWTLLFWSVIASFALVAAFYAVNGAIALAQGARQFAPFVLRHFKILAGVILILVAAGVFIMRYGLLFGGSGVVNGAGYADAYGTLPLMTVLSVALLFLGILVLAEVFTKRSLKLQLAGGLVAIIFGATIIYPIALQQLRVLPNELALERPFLERSISFTRKAFNIEEVDEQNFASSDKLTAADLVKNRTTIDNIRLWDWRPLLTTYGQIQEIRTYYSFKDVDVDRYDLAGKQQQLMVAARELSTEKLDENAQTWVNQHQIYLHGYGAVANPVNQIGEEGLPELLVKDIPPKTEVTELAIKRPEIYFGELTNEYALVKTKVKEFDYPGQDENVYATYKADSGVPIESFFNRAAFAVRFSALKILLSNAVTKDSRLLMNRNIVQAASEAAPFLRFDSDPYIVISGGRLVWVLDGYTVTDRYPYSERLAGVNYMRNSVKVVIDAYEGKPKFYLIDPKDPVAATYNKIFPSMFEPFEKMPADLKKHMRYPVDLFQMQSSILATYHMRSPEAFYNREDQWIFPKELFGSEEVDVEPYYVTMRLPGESKDEFMLFRPFNPRGKSNLISAFLARNDAPNYGKLVLLKFPKDRLVYGSMQVESLINQDPTISAQLALWNQEGSRVIRGNLIMVPLEDSLLYVEPLYLQSETGQLPELKRVVVSFKGKVTMQTSLGAGLAELFGAGAEAAAPDGGVTEGGGAAAGGTTGDASAGGAAPSPELNRLISQANRHLAAAEEAQRKGDWAKYGAELKALQNTLRQLDRLSR